MRDFLQLDFWQKSHQLTSQVYTLTRSFPKEELYGLTSQIRRSAASIPSNIAEGCGRNSIPELKHFLAIATGSSSELQYQLLLCKDLCYLSDQLFKELNAELITIRKMIFRYSGKLDS